MSWEMTTRPLLWSKSTAGEWMMIDLSEVVSLKTSPIEGKQGETLHAVKILYRSGARDEVVMDEQMWGKVRALKEKGDA